MKGTCDTFGNEHWEQHEYLDGKCIDWTPLPVHDATNSANPFPAVTLATDGVTEATDGFPPAGAAWSDAMAQEELRGRLDAAYAEGYDAGYTAGAGK